MSGVAVDCFKMICLCRFFLLVYLLCVCWVLVLFVTCCLVLYLFMFCFNSVASFD